MANGQEESSDWMRREAAQSTSLSDMASSVLKLSPQMGRGRGGQGAEKRRIDNMAEFQLNFSAWTNKPQISLMKHATFS